MKLTKKQTKTVLHLPYWKPDTKEKFLLIHGSYDCCCMFQYKILRCALTFLKSENLNQLMLAYHCHARGITNTDGLASSLITVRSVYL